MKWDVKFKGQKSNDKNVDEVIEILLNNRGIKTKKEKENFLSPASPDSLIPSAVGINQKNLDKAIKRIQDAIKNNEPIVVYGDYDVDGICSTAILWETLRDLKAKAMPFIPLREKEGYGLSVDGIKNIISDNKYGIIKGEKKQGLIICVDSGIVAHEPVEFANEHNLDVIILDHHEIGKNLPKAFTIVHTLELCAGGISFIFSKELCKKIKVEFKSNSKLELACIATIADLVPLVGPNRAIVKWGLQAVNSTSRVGLLALFEVAGIKNVGTYEIGYLIAPRINASGRIDNALVALRLLCTSDKQKAQEYAKVLNDVNKDRQGMLEEMTIHALETQNSKHKNQNLEEKIIVIDHESYHQGVIGLIAGKLVERFYLPAIVIAKGEILSKASARSISGFNIIESIRELDHILVGAGGHPMAAGFTIETTRIEEFKVAIARLAKAKITQDMMVKSLNVDCQLGTSLISLDLYNALQQLVPHGLGNPQPVFSTGFVVVESRQIGAEGKHLKMIVTTDSEETVMKPYYDAIAFGMGGRMNEVKPGTKISLAYNLDLNEYNGMSKLQLKVKDINLS